MNAIKGLIVAAFLCMVIGELVAQEVSEPQYLFDIKTFKLSGFGGVINEFSFTDGAITASTGGGAAFLFSYNYFFGFYGLSLATDRFRPDIYPIGHSSSNLLDPLYTDLQLSFENNGAWFGYINEYKKLIHWGANMKLGHGTLALFDRDNKYDKTSFLYQDNVFVASPEIELEVNLTRWFKVNMGVGYRFVTGFDNQTVTNAAGESVQLYRSSQFNSPYAMVKFLFGGFAKRNRSVNETAK